MEPRLKIYQLKVSHVIKLNKYYVHTNLKDILVILPSKIF